MRALTFVVWNFLLAGILPGNTHVLTTYRHPLQLRPGDLLENSKGYILMTSHPHSLRSYYTSGLNQKHGANLVKKKISKKRCIGKDNLLEDIGTIAIVSGGVGTVMGIFSAAYLSVLGNVISVISAILSFITGIPSAVITYLAATDRLTYSVANVLSVLSIANTIYGMWSIDIGNKDIILSQAGNAVGVVSLLLSIVSGFPEVFESILEGFRYLLGREVVNKFVTGYRCDGNDYWGDMILALAS